MANEVGRQQRKSVVFVVRPAVFDREVLALDIACLLQAPMERGQEGCVLAGWPTVEKPITGTTGCCARAASGHVTATPLRRVMNSRRLK
jgi:hypothetical protein